VNVFLDDAGDSTRWLFCITIPIKVLHDPVYGSHAGLIPVAPHLSCGEFHQMSYEQLWI
jgi:hypothetical protein